MRLRSSIALASAATLGLLALIATPKCVGSRLDAAQVQEQRQPQQPRQPQLADVVAKTAIALPSEARTFGAGAVAPTTMIEPIAPPLTEPQQTATPKPRIDEPILLKAPRARSSSSAPVRVTGGDHPVHGGLSSPGF